MKALRANNRRVIGTLFSLLLSGLLMQGCSDDSARVFGTVERDRLTIAAPVGEIISKINVVEGQKVQAGDVLLELDSTSATARVAQRQAELKQAQAVLAEAVKGARSEDIDSAKAALDGANASVKEAQKSFARAQQLVSAKLLSQADLDAARAARDTSLANQAQAQQSLQLLQNGTRSEQIDQARAAVEALVAAVAIEQKALSDLTLTAAQNAVVDTLAWRVGDRVAAGTQLIGLLATDHPYVRVYLPATWLERVKVGSAVNLLLDGSDKILTGKIKNIRSQPAYTPFYALNERDRARLMYLTDINIDANEEQGQDLPTSFLPTGLALEVALP